MNAARAGGPPLNPGSRDSRVSDSRVSGSRVSGSRACAENHPRSGDPPPTPSTSDVRAEQPTLVAVAHGTRDHAGTDVVDALLARVRALRPSLRVEVGYLDLAAPLLPDTLAALRGQAVLVPLLFSTGFHTRVDIPAALAAAPHLTASISRPLGPDPLLAEALDDRLSEATHTARTAAARHPQPVDNSLSTPQAIVLAAAGSTDPAAAGDTAAMARLLAARTGRPVTPAYLCAGTPTPAQAVSDLRKRGHDSIAVVGYLLAPGHFARRAAAAGATIATAPVGAHDAVARLVLRRYDETRATLPEPVDTGFAQA